MRTTSRARVLASILAAAGCLVAGLAAGIAPAAATTPSYQRVFGLAITGRNTVGTATVAIADCPVNTVVYGSGVIGPATGQVIIDSVVPSKDRVTATAYVDETGYTGSWTLQAVAVCGPLLPNYQISSDTDGTPSTTGSTVTSTCPGGTSLIGTGFESGAASGDRGEVVVRALTPNPTSSSPQSVNLVSAPDEDGVGTAFASTAWRVCASVDDVTVTMGSSGIASPTSQSVSVNCTPNQHVTGAGFFVWTGEQHLERLEPGATLVTARDRVIGIAYEDETGYADPWAITVYDICAGV